MMLAWSLGMMIIFVELFSVGFMTLQIVLSFLISSFVFHWGARLLFFRERIRGTDLVAIDYVALAVAGSALLAIADIERGIAKSWAENMFPPGIESSRQRVESSVDVQSIDFWCDPPPAWKNTESNCKWMKEANNLISNGYETEAWSEFLDKSYLIYGTDHSEPAWWQSAASFLCLGNERYHARDGFIVSTLDQLFCEHAPRLRSGTDVAMIEGVIYHMQDHHERQMGFASLNEIALLERDPFISYFGYFMLATALAFEFVRITARRSDWYPD